MRPLIIEAIRDPQAIDGVNPLEVSCDITGLVGLNLPDKMPRDIKGLEFLEFSYRFLNNIFPKIADTGIVGGPNGRCRLSLAYRQECDDGIGRVPAELRIPDPFERFYNAVLDLSHALT